MYRFEIMPFLLLLVLPWTATMVTATVDVNRDDLSMTFATMGCCSSWPGYVARDAVCKTTTIEGVRYSCSDILSTVEALGCPVDGTLTISLSDCKICNGYVPPECHNGIYSPPASTLFVSLPSAATRRRSLETTTESAQYVSGALGPEKTFARIHRDGATLSLGDEVLTRLDTGGNATAEFVSTPAVAEEDVVETPLGSLTVSQWKVSLSDDDRLRGGTLAQYVTSASGYVANLVEVGAWNDVGVLCGETGASCPIRRKR